MYACACVIFKMRNYQCLELPIFISTFLKCSSKDVRTFTVTLGDYNTTKREGSEQVIAASTIVIHPQYSPNNMNDIALVRLQKPADISSNYVNKACLPHEMDIFTPSDYCYATGWGTTKGIPHLKISPS